MAVVVPIIVPVIVRKQRRLVDAFRAAGATEPAKATPLAALALEDGHALKLLRSHGIVQEAGDQKLWLDEARWNAHQARRTRIASTIVATMLVLVVGGLVVLWFATH